MTDITNSKKSIRRGFPTGVHSPEGDNTISNTITRRAALTGSAAGAAAIVDGPGTTLAAASYDPHARIEEFAAELVDCLREIAGPDAFRVQFLLNSQDRGAVEHRRRRVFPAAGGQAAREGRLDRCGAVTADRS